LSNRLSNGFGKRFDNRVERTATVRSTGCQTRFDNRVERRAVRSTGCQTGLYNRFDNRLYTRYSRLSNGFDNRFDNRLYRVNEALECRSETCCARLAANTARKKSPKSRHLGTIPQLCRAISSQLRHVTDAISRQRLRSGSRHQVIVPRHRRTNFGRRAFTVAGPSAWNSLPDYLRDPSLSEDTFRRLLKTYLFALY